MAQKSLLQKFHKSYLKMLPNSIRKCSTDNLDKDESESNFYIKCVNEVKLLGYVGQAPKQYQLDGNKFVTYFCLATNRHYCDKSDTMQKITTWHTILVRKSFLQDYVMKYIGKGTRAYISGYLDSKTVDFTDEFQTKAPVYVVAEEVIFLKKPVTYQNENSPFLLNLRGNYGAYD